MSLSIVAYRSTTLACIARLLRSLRGVRIAIQMPKERALALVNECRPIETLFASSSFTPWVERRCSILRLHPVREVTQGTQQLLRVCSSFRQPVEPARVQAVVANGTGIAPLDKSFKEVSRLGEVCVPSFHVVEEHTDDLNKIAHPRKT